MTGPVSNSCLKWGEPQDLLYWGVVRIKWVTSGEGPREDSEYGVTQYMLVLWSLPAHIRIQMFCEIQRHSLPSISAKIQTQTYHWSHLFFQHYIIKTCQRWKNLSTFQAFSCIYTHTYTQMLQNKKTSTFHGQQHAGNSHTSQGGYQELHHCLGRCGLAQGKGAQHEVVSSWQSLSSVCVCARVRVRERERNFFFWLGCSGFCQNDIHASHGLHQHSRRDESKMQ